LVDSVFECTNSWILVDAVFEAESVVAVVFVADNLNPCAVRSADLFGFLEVKSLLVGICASRSREENVIDAN
jgi:hypothetical protein